MGNIIRDPDAMEKFAMAILRFDENVKGFCDRLENAVAAAESGMQDAATQKAAESLYDLISEIRKITEMDDTAQNLSIGAKKLRRVDEIRWG